ncbi:MAG: sodium-dependent transporter [Lachnospiraceae bacterium]|nr:sodium-dependent transporter [Lachnospiraceae bacterium]
MGQQKRENFASRMGFILVSAGCAIGIGNVWKFPYMAGQNGGAIFVLFYLIFLVIMGIPVLTMELAIGRGSGKTIVEAYRTLEKEGTKWHIHGWFCIAGCYLLMMYYTTVAGWMLAYFWKFLTGTFDGKNTEAVTEVFTDMLANPVEMIIFMAIVVIAGFLVLSFGVQNGLERVNKFMMIGLLGIIILLSLKSFTLSNAAEGLSFYLMPNMENVNQIGLGNVVTAAMSQAFFTLSIGIASMEIFGSYMSKDYTLTGEAVKICVLDTFVALLSGFIIFPACFSFGIEPDAGPSLIFITLPGIFTNMHLGRLWGTLFFLFMTFASFSTVIAVFENLVGSSMDNLKWSRKKSVIINCIVMLIASLPCLLGYNILSNVHLIGGRDILDSEDFIVSYILLPLGALLYVLFCTTNYGWGADNYLNEVNTGEGIKMSRKLLFYFRYVLTVLIIVLFITGLF